MKDIIKKIENEIIGKLQSIIVTNSYNVLNEQMVKIHLWERTADDFQHYNSFTIVTSKPVNEIVDVLKDHFIGVEVI